MKWTRLVALCALTVMFVAPPGANAQPAPIAASLVAARQAPRNTTLTAVWQGGIAPSATVQSSVAGRK